jgi:DNA primase
MHARVAIVSEAKDPDEFLRGAGPEAKRRWEALVANAPAEWEFWIKDSIAGLNTARPRDLQLALERTRAVLERVKDPAVRESYRLRSAEWLGVEPHLLVDGAPPVAPPARGAVASAADAVVRSAHRNNTAGRYLLQVLAVRPDAVPVVQARLQPEDLEEDERGAYALMLETISRGGLEALNRALDTFLPEDQDLIRRAWASPPPSLDDEVVDDLVHRIRREALQKRVRAIMTDLAAAEQKGDSERASVLFAAHRDVSRALEALKQGKRGR